MTSLKWTIGWSTLPIFLNIYPPCIFAGFPISGRRGTVYDVLLTNQRAYFNINFNYFAKNTVRQRTVTSYFISIFGIRSFGGWIFFLRICCYPRTDAILKISSRSKEGRLSICRCFYFFDFELDVILFWIWLKCSEPSLYN